jgi:nucleoid-associated protein YgaU
MGLEKAEITNTFTGERFKVLFNPGEYTINKDNNFAQVAVPGLRSPLLQFVHGNMRTLEMELFFDTYDTPKLPKRDVREETNKIVRLLDIDPERHAPPVLLFVWGDLRFTCVLARASQRFTMFAEDGRPVRARLTVTFNEFTNADREAKEIKRSTADFTKLHVVAQGETLSSIAEQLYRNPALWRPIAIVNEVDNPRKLPVGLRLRVPPLPFRDPQSGEVFE